MRMFDLFEAVHAAMPSMERPAVHETFHVETWNNLSSTTRTETVWRQMSEEEAHSNLSEERLRFIDESTQETLLEHAKALGLDDIDDTNTPYELYELVREATSMKVAFMPVIYLC